MNKIQETKGVEAIVLLEKSKPALEGVSKEGDEMATVNIGEIGVLKRVCSNSLAGLGSKLDRWGIRSRRNKLKKNPPLALSLAAGWLNIRKSSGPGSFAVTG